MHCLFTDGGRELCCGRMGSEPKRSIGDLIAVLINMQFWVSESCGYFAESRVMVTLFRMIGKTTSIGFFIFMCCLVSLFT